MFQIMIRMLPEAIAPPETINFFDLLTTTAVSKILSACTGIILLYYTLFIMTNYDNVHILGPSGSGKSVLLVSLILDMFTDVFERQSEDTAQDKAAKANIFSVFSRSLQRWHRWGRTVSSEA